MNTGDVHVEEQKVNGQAMAYLGSKNNKIIEKAQI
jgi:hypothetical protein